MSDGDITVCRVGTDGKMSFPSIPNTVAGLQECLGGYFEAIALVPPLNWHMLGLVDETGLSKQLPENEAAEMLTDQPVLVGPLVIVRVQGEDFASLTGDDIAALTYFGKVVAP